MYKSHSTITGQILTAEHIGTTVNGNGRYRVTVKITAEDGVAYDGEHFDTFITSSDSACAYGVENYLPRPHRGIAAPLVTLGLTRARRVETITEVCSCRGGTAARCDGCR